MANAMASAPTAAGRADGDRVPDEPGRAERTDEPGQARPAAPPASPSTEASTRNCRRISRGVAPRALRRPISRIRSVTETNMMFITPIPPTSNEMAAMPPSRMVRVWSTEVAVDQRLLAG